MTVDSGEDNDGYEVIDFKEIPIENGQEIKQQERVVEVQAIDKELEAQQEMLDDDDNQPCGWFFCRPRCIQCCNRPGGYLFFLCIFALAQSTTVNGLIYVIVTTLERRFNLTSARSGAISSCYDFSVMIVVVFVTYFGEKAHKPLWIGSGAIIFGMGSFLFTLPHFLTDEYTYGGVPGEETCSADRNLTDSCLIDDQENLSRYYWFFVVAQVLHGIGASPLYTLGQAFLYSNSKPTTGALFIGIFQASSMFAPAIGYIGGGLFLSIYTDIKIADQQNIDPTSPLWVGAWWLGFMCTGSAAILVAIPLLAFPKSLPGVKKAQKEREKSTQKGSEFKTTSTTVTGRVKEFPAAMKNLFTNAPYMCITLATAAENFILACVAVFGPKFVESVFTLTSGQAAFFAGLVVIPSALAGCLLGGILIKIFKWGYKGRMRFLIASLTISWLVMPAVFVQCPGLNFAGVTIEYGNPESVLDIGDSNITGYCNLNCGCTDDYDPVCAPSTNIMYYSACHAGCKVLDDTNDKKEYFDCGCIPDGNGGYGGEATQGKCYEDCNNLRWFSVLIFVMLFCTFAVVVPSVTGIFEVVDINQRTTALGLQSVFYRCLGTVPGPIVFGLLIDRSCMIWEEECEGLRKCWLYENGQFAMYMFIIVFSCRAIALAFYLAAYFLYTPALKTITDQNSIHVPAMADKGTDTTELEKIADGKFEDHEVPHPRYTIM
ncbi:solute carrier organic anion transporter family member 4A1-like [Apostichopus japonicus]|uniref:solute carrier organic anion transporter family member 4A1-like n=1 Tax=Stichopus japonicus TaxID=307972 RepID=UPI003AB4E50D